MIENRLPAGAPADPQPRRVLVLDDNEMVLAVLQEVIATDPGLVVVGAARRVGEAVRLAADLQPDVAVVDVNMPEGGGWAAARGLREVCPCIRLVAYSAFDDALVTHTMVSAGMSAFVIKGSNVELLLAAIHGQDVMPSESAAHWLSRRKTEVVLKGAPLPVSVPVSFLPAAWEWTDSSQGRQQPPLRINPD